MRLGVWLVLQYTLLSTSLERWSTCSYDNHVLSGWHHDSADCAIVNLCFFFFFFFLHRPVYILFFLFAYPYHHKNSLRTICKTIGWKVYIFTFPPTYRFVILPIIWPPECVLHVYHRNNVTYWCFQSDQKDSVLTVNDTGVSLIGFLYLLLFGFKCKKLKRMQVSLKIVQFQIIGRHLHYKWCIFYSNRAVFLGNAYPGQNLTSKYGC